MNWQLLIQALGVVTGGLVAAYQIRQLLPRSRSQLKADLEILKLLDPADENYPVIRAHVNRSVQDAYGAGRAGNKLQVDWPLLTFFAVFSVGFTTWTLHLIRSRQDGWAVLTAGAAIICYLGLVGSFSPRRSGQSR